MTGEEEEEEGNPRSGPAPVWAPSVTTNPERRRESRRPLASVLQISPDSSNEPAAVSHWVAGGGRGDGMGSCQSRFKAAVAS